MFAPRRTAILIAFLGSLTLCPAVAPPPFRLDADGDPLPHGAVKRLGTCRMFHPGYDDLEAFFTPDGSFLMTMPVGREGSSSLGGRSLVWDLKTGRLVRHFGYAEGGIHHAVQSPDGRRVMSVGQSGSFLWEIPSGRLVRRLEPEKEFGQEQSDRTAFRDEKTLVVIRDRCLGTLDLENGRRVEGVRLFEENSSPAGPLVLSPDGKWVVTTGAEGLRMIDAATGKPRGGIRIPFDEGWTVAFHPNGKVFAIERGAKNTVQIYDTLTLRKLREWNLGEKAVCNLLDDGPFCTFVPGGNLLATPGLKCSVDLWDWSTGKIVRKLGESMGGPPGLTFSRDGKRLASAESPYRIRVFDVDTGKESLTFEGQRSPVTALRYLDKDRLVCTSWAGPHFTWDVHTGRVVDSLTRAMGNDILSPDGKILARPNLDTTVLLLDAATGKKRHLLGVCRPLRQWAGNMDRIRVLVPPVAFSPDSCIVALGHPDGVVRLWSVDTGKGVGTLATQKGHRFIEALAFSRDGRRLAAGGDELTVWEVASKKILRDVTLPADERQSIIAMSRINGVAFTPDGSAVAVADSGGSAGLWDIASGRQRLRSGKRESGCSAVACSPDGRLVASAESGEAILLWDAASGREVGRLRPGGRPAPPARRKDGIRPSLLTGRPDLGIGWRRPDDPPLEDPGVGAKTQTLRPTLSIRCLPVDRLLAHIFERIVYRRERLRPHEFRRRQRRGVGGRHDAVVIATYPLRLLLGVVSPEGEDDGPRPLVEYPDDGVGERLPAAALMRVRLAGADGEDGVEQQHAALGPLHEVAVVRHLTAEVCVQLTEHVGERGRRANAGADAEAHPVRLPRAVVGVLAQEQDFHVRQRRDAEGAEDIGIRGVDRVRGSLRRDERAELYEVGRGELVRECVAPVGGEPVGCHRQLFDFGAVFFFGDDFLPFASLDLASRLMTVSASLVNALSACPSSSSVAWSSATASV